MYSDIIYIMKISVTVYEIFNKIKKKKNGSYEMSNVSSEHPYNCFLMIGLNASKVINKKTRFLCCWLCE